MATSILTLQEEGRIMSRPSFEESIERLKALGIIGADETPRLPDQMPQADDEDPCGLSIYRMALEGRELDGLSLPRTFFGLSEISECTFRSADLSESNLCWNGFHNVDFSGADMTGCDLRASIYENVNFSGANLSQADLRQCDFVGCTFAGATLSGAKLTREAAEALDLSDSQRSSVDWQADEGDEPLGG
jgi:uncharacterized protein YjbI with pentapeptide repeats